LRNGAERAYRSNDPRPVPVLRHDKHAQPVRQFRPKLADFPVFDDFRRIPSVRALVFNDKNPVIRQDADKIRVKAARCLLQREAGGTGVELIGWHTALRPELGRVIRSLAEQKGSAILEGHLRPDHVHILVSIPPKLPVSSVVGFIKGKSAIFIARNFVGRRRNFVGESFWARGFYVSTVGLDEEVIRNYIKHQEKEDQRLDQLTLL